MSVDIKKITSLLEKLTPETQDVKLKRLASQVLMPNEDIDLDGVVSALQTINDFGNESYTRTFKQAVVIAFCGSDDATYHKNIGHREAVLDAVGGDHFKAYLKHRDPYLIDDYCAKLVESGHSSCLQRFAFFGVRNNEQKYEATSPSMGF